MGKHNNLEDYYSNPNKCKYCNTSILPQPGKPVCTAIRKLFCNNSCSGKYRVQNGIFPPEKIRVNNTNCRRCKTELYCIRTVWCEQCLFIINEEKENKQKQNCLSSEISRHAQSKVLNRERKCCFCDYSTHVEVCHIKDVRYFLPTDTLRLINAPDNLILLCPNCHWEFDHNLITRVLNTDLNNLIIRKKSYENQPTYKPKYRERSRT